MADFDFSKIDGILFDLDGVLYVGGQPIDGAVETVRYVKERKPVRFVTNTTTRPLDMLFDKLKKLGIPAEEHEIFTPPKAAVAWLKKRGEPKLFLIVEPDTSIDFADFEQVSDNPDYVVIGHYGRRWSYDLLNRAFHMLMDGAGLLALHKGRYWQTEDGLQLDIGAFVVGLEHATGQTAAVMGKPSENFFKLPIEDMGLQPSRVMMIGDDINSDIGGAMAIGCKGGLVKTGKYRDDLAQQSDVTPTVTLDSINDLKDLL